MKMTTAVNKRLRLAFLTGYLSFSDILKARRLMRSPSFVQALEDRLIDELVALGRVDATADRSAIDWDAILDFIEKLIPIIIKLIELFT